jgi:hypothetical protein
MAVGCISLLEKTVLASAALTQFRGATLAGAAVSAAGNGYIAAVGAASGARTTVTVLGTCIAEAGAAVAVNALLEFDSSGRVVTRSTGAIVGRAITAGSAAGAQIEMLVIPN